MKSVAIAVACTLLACGASTRPRLKYGYYSGPTISGTVTSVTAGSGLTGGTITRSGTIAVDTSTTQSRVSGVCTGSNAIQTIAADGSVTCVAGGSGGGGTVTSITAGTGLTGGTITGSGTIAADTTFLQERVSGTCGAGNAIQVINSDGTVTCQAVGSGTVTGTGTSGDLMAWSGSTAATNYAGTTCGAGTAIQTLSAAGAASCITVGGGGVTSVATSAPITGGTITTTGTIGLSESSNLRTNGSALDLSTAVTMPGSLTTKNVNGTIDAQSLSAGSVTLTPSSTATIEQLTCTGTTTITAMPACTAGRVLDVIVTNASTGVCDFADSASIVTPGASDVPLHGNSGGRLTCTSGGVWQFTAAGAVTSVAAGTSISTSGINGQVTVSLNHPTISCSAGQHVSAVSSAGTPTCSADAPTNGLTGTLTSGVVPVATGTHGLGDGDISDNTATQAVSIAGSASSSLDYNGQLAKFGSTRDGGVYLEGASVASLNFEYSTAGAADGYINRLSNAAGTTNFRNLHIQDGEANDVVVVTGSSKATEFMGAATVDGALVADGHVTLGNGAATEVAGMFSVYNKGTPPTISDCGTGASIAGESTNNGGTITLGTTPGTCVVTFSTATGYTFTNAPACTVSPGSTDVKGALYISVSATSLTINGTSAGTSGDKVFYTCIGEKN